MNPKILKILKTATSKYNPKALSRFSISPTTGSSIQKKLIGATMASLMLYASYEYHPNNTKIRLSYSDHPENEEIVSRLSSLYDKHFKPTFFLTTPLMQCIYQKAKPDVDIQYQREALTLADGGQITLDWSNPKKRIDSDRPNEEKWLPYEPSEENKVLFVLHGLTGGSEAGYIKMLVETANRAGYRVVVMNHRGINQELKTPKPYHGGDLSDLEYAVDYVRAKYPNAPMMAVGLSLGGNQMFRYLGKMQEKTDFLAAALLAVPFDIDACVDAIENTVYEKFFIKRYLQMNVLPHMHVYNQLKHTHGIDMEDVFKAKSLRDFHSKFTVKIYNHKDVRDLFSTTKIDDNHIQGIKIPTLILQSKDDPIAVNHIVPREKLASNPNIIYAETSHGGHLAWFSGLKPRRWYAEPTVEFLDTILEHKTKRFMKPWLATA